ncbi:MAG TPA: nucleotidyltransferase substrate binding protein [Catalimonadaceae bacterium]|nr:nucleotidyltransferase substrate binding protein [Catalimonadaceae bacterium]HPI12198.1 nucleotidyltransferase substrate binding protein [Catalimonadaceae bacterium]
MHQDDIRWEQRFSNFRKALAKLEEVVNHKPIETLSDLEKEGLIQRFEYSYELAWKTLQDLLRFKGYINLSGPNPVIGQAFQDGIIEDGEAWKRMKKSRDLSTHTYDQETADGIVQYIYDDFLKALKALEKRISEERSGKQTDLFRE